MAGRIFLIHWNRAEAEVYAQALRDLDWEVEFEAEDGARGAKAIKASPPEAIVIYHTRLPSHGRQTAAYIYETKATRHLPAIFVSGEGEALAKTKAKLPEAIYTSEGDLANVLARFKKKEN